MVLSSSNPRSLKSEEKVSLSLYFKNQNESIKSIKKLNSKEGLVEKESRLNVSVESKVGAGELGS